MIAIMPKDEQKALFWYKKAADTVKILQFDDIFETADVFMYFCLFLCLEKFTGTVFRWEAIGGCRERKKSVSIIHIMCTFFYFCVCNQFVCFTPTRNSSNSTEKPRNKAIQMEA